MPENPPQNTAGAPAGSAAGASADSSAGASSPSTARAPSGDPDGLLVEAPQPFVDRLVHDLAVVHWPQPAEIRARARRRSLRTAVGTPMVIVLVIVGAWVVTADRGHPGGGPPVEMPPIPIASGVTAPPGAVATMLPTPSIDDGGSGATPSVVATPAQPTATASTDPAWIPPEALLQPDDLGPGHQSQPGRSFASGAYPTWAFNLDEGCPSYAALGVTAPQRYRYLRTTQIVQGFGVDGGQRLHEEVSRYPAGTAGQVLADTRRVILACHTFDGLSTASADGRPAVVNHRWAVRDDDFAGDESLLVRQEVVPVDRVTHQRTGTTVVVLYAVVRVDDLVAVLRSEDHSEPRVRQLAARAAIRMCPAATRGC